VGNSTIELPKNIASRSFRFGSPAKAVKTWTPEEFQRVVAESSGKLKLALLLMANCAYTQQDISDLRDEEIDWIEGRVIRKRSKTANCENVPTVNYKLWPATFALLKQFRDGGERVLLTESGKPFVRTELVGGKLRKADGFASNFVHVKKSLQLQRSLKQLRKLGATLMDAHKDYGRFKSYFLGHSPRTVADRHYAPSPRKPCSMRRSNGWGGS
jgi:integrase